MQLGYTMVSGPFRAFAHRNFRLYWMGMCVSLIGTWMQTVGQSWLVLELTDSAFLLGLQTALQYVPALILTLPAGCVADRLPKRWLLIVTQSSMMVLAFVQAALTLSGRIAYWHLAVLSFFVGISTAFDMPVRHSFMIEMVGREDLTSAISLNSAMFNVARIVGPAAAGLVMGAFGAGIAFLVNGLSFLAIIASLLLIDVEEQTSLGNLREQLATLWTDVAQGLSFIRGTPRVLLTLASLTLMCLFVFNYQVLVPVFARQVLGQDATGYGLLMTATGIGALAGAIASSFINSGGPQSRMVRVGSFAASAISLAVAAVRSYYSAAVLLAAYGWWMVVFTSTVNAVLQMSSPDHLRGRVMSVYSLILLGSVPFGGLYVGSISNVLGARWGFALGGIAGIASAWLVLAWQRRLPSEKGIG